MANRVAKLRQTRTRISLRDYIALAKAIRECRPWDDLPSLASALAVWAGPTVDLATSWDAAHAIVQGDFRQEQDLESWSDGAIALWAWEHMSAYERGVSWPPEFAEPLVAEQAWIPERTRRRRRDDGVAYLYNRNAREFDLSELVRRGRKLPAARRWLERNRGMHFFDAPRPHKS